jgi:hypothetical protein
MAGRGLVSTGGAIGLGRGASMDDAASMDGVTACTEVGSSSSKTRRCSFLVSGRAGNLSSLSTVV